MHDPHDVDVTGEAAALEEIAEQGTRPLGARPHILSPEELAAQRGYGTEPLGDDEPGSSEPAQRLVAAAALRDIGRVRSSNQDHVFALVSSIPREAHDVTLGLFIVADGMGGHEGGETASRMAISSVVRTVVADLLVPAVEGEVGVSLQALMVAAVQEANRTIWEHARTIGSDMGTTCTAALLLGRSLYIGHVGDTRAYLVGPQGMRQITVDHSAVGRLIQLGQLSADEARDHPLRSQLYRTVGQHHDVTVDMVFQPVGDATHLLLASDGLWGLVEEDELLQLLTGAASPQHACQVLIEAANRAGGPDNISAVVVALP